MIGVQLYIYIYTHIYVCKGVTDRLLKHIQRVHPAAFCSRDFVLLHDNAPAHKAVSICQYFTQKLLQPSITPPYSPDLSPPDYLLFTKLKMKLKGLHFADVDEISNSRN